MLGNNLLIMGLDENSALTRNETNADMDEDKVKLLNSFLNPDIEINVCKIFRLGKPSGGLTRPLKVKFQDEETVRKILANSKKLKEILEGKVYIKPDKTKTGLG